MIMKRNILITGGAGFIGSNLVKMLVKRHQDWMIYNLDALTYAGNLENLQEVENCENYKFIKGNICDEKLVNDIFEKYEIDGVFHLAAESHVDRSITGPMIFQETNVKGTCVLLEAAKNAWKDNYDNKTFLYVSTDEVYGSLNLNDDFKFTEDMKYDPHSPYSASKASGDLFVKAYYDTFKLPVKITHCSNNYGPNQYPEKLIPLVIDRIINNENIPVYGKGDNIRDWIHVEDHCDGLEKVFLSGKNGETYNLGGENEISNIEIVHTLIKILDKILGRNEGDSLKLIKYVEDRKGHDKRYAIDIAKVRNELGWQPKISWEFGIEDTVIWYLDNKEWIEHIKMKV